ncbi:S41 family peptidase [Guggenheimella bovis]
MKKSTVLVLLLIVAILSAGITYYILGNTSLVTGNRVVLTKTEYDQYQALNTRFKKVIELEKHIKTNFYTDTKEVDFDSYILKGLFSALKDPYSTYYTKDEMKAFQEDMEGSFVGIGTYVEKMDNGLIKVVSPIQGSPAQKAGILSGDLIYQVDETDITEMSLQEAVKLMRGEEGTDVTIHLLRGSEKKTFDLKRQRIVNPSVVSSVKDGDIGYIQIVEFNLNTRELFDKALADLESKNVKSYIFDVRNNPGGDLDVVSHITDQLLGAGVIVTTKDRAGNEEVTKSDAEHKLDKPMVVLTNQGSASASEIFSGALKDHKVATLIGDKTFGKGIVQSVHQLPDGTGFKLTTSYWVTPSGHIIHKEGIAPDITREEVEKKGYKSPERYEIGTDQDSLLKFAIDFLKGRTK